MAFSGIGDLAATSSAGRAGRPERAQSAARRPNQTEQKTVVAHRRDLARKDNKVTCLWHSRSFQTIPPWILLFFWAGLGSAVPQVLRTQKGHPTIVSHGDPLPIFLQPRALLQARWVGGRMVGIEENDSHDPQLYTVTTDGPPERIRFVIPDSGHIRINDVAAGPDGALALGGSAYAADGKFGTFIAWIAPDRRSQTVTRTWPYVPWRITLAADGSIWTAGWVKDPPSRDVKMQFNVIKRFDQTGRVLTTSAPRARAAPEEGRGDAVGGFSFLRASSDRVGWLTNGMEYIEFSLDGREIDRFEDTALMEHRRHASLSLALSSDNQVMIGVVVNRRDWTIWALDRERRAWIRHDVTGPGEPTWGHLLGFDGPFLVADVIDSKMRRTRGLQQIVQRYKVPGAP